MFTPAQENKIALCIFLVGGLSLWAATVGKPSEAGRILFAASLVALLMGLG